MSAPIFRFGIGAATNGFTAPLPSDRIDLTFAVNSGPLVNMSMSTTEARAMANALYEAADAAEKVLPVWAATASA